MVEAVISSYLPLYRKYRPQKFSDLVGQESVTKILSAAIELNKVSHAYLFTGSRGTGKTSSARIFAKSLNCEKGPTPNPCGICHSCIDITAGRAVDVIEIDAASNRSVEQARNILEKVQFAPVAGKYKIYIIDEVHMLTKEAFNTLLKTLEEPPRNLVFILATTEAHKVLETIVSRCQKFDFKRIKTDLIVNLLKEISKIENINITDEALFIIARKALGGLRDALSLLDQISILSLTGKAIDEDDLLKMLGSLSDETLFEITQALAEKNPKNILKFIDFLYEKGNEPVQIIRELVGYFRNLMLAKTSSSYEEIKELILNREEFYSKLKKQSESFEVVEITQIIDKFAECEKSLKSSSQQGLWLETGLISICHRHDIHVVKDLQERIEKLEKIILSGQKPVMTPAVSFEKSVFVPPAPFVRIESTAEIKPETVVFQEQISQKVAPVKPIQSTTSNEVVETFVASNSQGFSNSKEDLSKSWELLLQKMPESTKQFFFQLSVPVEITLEKIVVTFKLEMFVKKAQDEGKVELLEKAGLAIFGVIPRVTIRTAMAEDKNIIKAQKISSSQTEKPVQKKNEPITSITVPHQEINVHESAQITSEIVEDPQPKVVKRTEEVKTISSENDDDEYEEMKITTTRIQRLNLPETAEHLLNVFNGKLLD